MKIVTVNGNRTLHTDALGPSLQECNHDGYIWICDGTRDRMEVAEIVRALSHWLEHGRLPEPEEE